MSALRLDFVPSRRLAVLILGMHAAAAACAALVVPGTAGTALAAALAALGLAGAWSRALLGSRNSIRGLDIGGEGVVVHLAGGESFPAEVGARRYVSRLMVALPLLRPARRSLLVTADMLDPALFRRFRIWALWGKLPVAAKPLPG